MGYLWIKAVHVMAVISWMAGLFYLPRLFVYHADTPPGSETSELFKVMERRLLKAIMVPAGIVTWVLGLTMAIISGLYGELWMQMKFILVVAMTMVHLRLTYHQHQFAKDQNQHSSRYFRILNEAPTLLMIFIVILVIVKPI